MKAFRLFILCLLEIGTAVYAQPAGLHFRNFGPIKDNIDEFVIDILKDSKGRVWIAGLTGFYRYDGAHFQEYRKTKDSSSLINNFIHSLCEDKKGNIWGGTEMGAFRFSPETQVFHRLYVPLPNSPQSILNIICDSEGTIWGTTPYHLLRFNVQADSFELAAPIHSNPDSLQSHAFKSNGMLFDPKNKTIWLATRAGICSYNTRTRKFQNYLTNPENALFKRANTAALSAASGGLFMFFDNVQKVVVRFDPAKQLIQKQISLKNAMPDALGISLFESQDRKIWFSSWTDAPVIIEQQYKDSIYALHTNVNEPLSLASAAIWAFMQDDDGTVWAGTSAGISVCNPDKSLFRIHRLGELIPTLDSKISLNAFTEDPADRTWWLLTSDLQIIHYNPLTGASETKPISHALPDKKGEKPVYIRGVNIFNGTLAVSSMEGTWLWQPGKLPFIPLESVVKYEFPIIIRRMMGTDGVLYYMSDFKQIITWDKVTRTAKIIPRSNWHLFDSSGAIEPKVNFHDDQPMFATAGMGVILKVDRDSLRPLKVISNLREINSAYINDIDGDNDGNIWICHSGGGLIKYSTDKGTVRVWDESNGLSYNQIKHVSLDNSKNVWCVYNRSFSVLLAKTETFFNFSIPLSQKKSAWENFMYTLQNGNIIANNFNNLVEFFPERLLLKPQIKQPEISSFFVGEKMVAHLNGSDLELNPDQNDISLRFGLLTDKSLFPYILRYRLDGADTDWKTANEAAEANYNKLPPGKYTFRVKGIAQNGVWETKETLLSFQILKPFYVTYWFLLITATAIFALFYGIYRYRLQQHKQIFNLETKTSALEREKATIQYDSLKQQLNPHFLFNSLTSLAGLIETDQEMASGFLQSMSDMYRYILKNGEQETVLLKDEIKFAQFYIDIQQTRFGKGLQVMMDVPDDYENFKIAPVTLQNLIENAIKHNIIDPGSPLQIRIYPEEDYLIVSNNLQKKHMVETSNKTGLAQFTSLYKFLSEKPVVIEETGEEFVVKIPLV